MYRFFNGSARPAFRYAWWSAIILNMLAGLLLPACSTTPEGKRAKADAVIIQKNAVIAQKTTLDAKDSNASASHDVSDVQTLDSRIDQKDAVLLRAKIIP